MCELVFVIINYKINKQLAQHYLQGLQPHPVTATLLEQRDEDKI